MPIAAISSLAFVVAFALACGGDEFEDKAAAVEGIYEVRTHTENLDACEPGGDSLTGADVDGMLIAKRLPLFGTPNLTMLSCADPADCRDKLARHEDRLPYSIDFSFSVQSVNSDGLLTGTGVSTGFEMDDVCKQGAVFTTTIALDGDAVTVVQRRVIADDYAPDNGFCTTDRAQDAAQGNDCTQLEQLVADATEPL